MLTRKTRFVALNILFAGSVTAIAIGEDVTPVGKTPSIPPASPGVPAQPTMRKPIKPKELNAATKKGLAYLVGQQQEDGGFGQGGGWRQQADGGSGRVEGKDVKDPPDVGNTCMAALALIRAGNTPKEGEYSKQLVKAVEFVETHVESADKDSLYVTPIRDTQLQSKIGRYTDTFLTALLLSELKGQMSDKKSEERLFAALNKTIGKIELNQQADGTFAGNAGWASVLSQGLCSKALSRATQKGITVKAETIRRDLDQTVAQLSTDKGTGSPSPAESSTESRRSLRAGAGLGPAGKGDAGVQLYSLAANGGRVQDTVNANQQRKTKAESIVNSPTADEKSKEVARVELKDVAAAESANGEAKKQLTANLGDAKFLRGFGNNGGEEFLSYMNISETLLAQGGEAWENWDRKVCETITQVQNEDGSWSGHHCITGRTFCTASALLTMMADRAPLPAMTDTKPTTK